MRSKRTSLSIGRHRRQSPFTNIQHQHRERRQERNEPVTSGFLTTHTVPETMTTPKPQLVNSSTRQHPSFQDGGSESRSREGFLSRRRPPHVTPRALQKRSEGITLVWLVFLHEPPCAASSSGSRRIKSSNRQRESFPLVPLRVTGMSKGPIRLCVTQFLSTCPW